MKFSPKCRTKKLGMIYTIVGSFCYFLNWKGAIYGPKSGLGKSLYNVFTQGYQCYIITFPNKHEKLDHYRPAREMPSEWRFTGRPIVA